MAHLLTAVEGAVRVVEALSSAKMELEAPYVCDNVDADAYRINRVDGQGNLRSFDALELHDSENDDAWIMSDTARLLENHR